MIAGGYILQPRCFDKSDAAKMSPVTRELWFYLLRNVNHKTTSKNERGSRFFSLGDIQEGLHWYVGYRKMVYSKPQISKALRRLNEGNDEGPMTATVKATRGLIITILNYDKYQSPKNYEGNDEGSTKATMKVEGGSHYKQECKERKNERSKTPLTPQGENQKSESNDFKKYLLQKIETDGFQDSKDQIIIFFEYRMRKPKAKQYQSEKGINGLFRSLDGCRAAGLNLFDCLEIAMEENWQAPKPEYFKTASKTNGRFPNGTVMGTKRMDANVIACQQFIDEE